MNTRYSQSKDRSAELFRTTVRYMNLHDAAWNPITFTVWYEYAASLNQALSTALENALAAEPRLSDATIARLYLDHIDHPEPDLVQQVSRDLQRIMTGVAENASTTGEQAGAFGAQITDLQSAIETQEPSTLAPILGLALASAAKTQRAAQTLEQQVGASRLEIDRLRADLTRAKDEALLDPLTRVLNRKGLDQRLNELVRDPPKNGTVHNLILIDIDHFKRVNDTHGHVLGDQVIQGLATVLRSCLEAPDQSVSRYGGEEFAILLPHSTPRDGLRLASLVLQRTKAMKLLRRGTQEVVLSVTVSAGVAQLRPGEEAQSWVMRADRALYASKEAGRDRVTAAGDPRDVAGDPPPSAVLTTMARRVGAH